MALKTKIIFKFLIFICIIKYYVNGKYFGYYKNKEITFDKNILKIGVIVCGKEKVAFDNIKVISK